MEKGLLLILTLMFIVATVYLASFAGTAFREMVRQQESLTRLDSPASPARVPGNFWTPPVSFTSNANSSRTANLVR